MEEYHKIQTVFKRNPNNKFRTLIEGEYSLPEFEYLKDNEWIFTEKVDGTNIRIIYDINKPNIIYQGKTNNAQISTFLLDKLNSIFLPIFPKIQETFTDGICFYGEGYGAKIQKGGGNYRRDQGFVLFDILIGNWWLQRENIEEIAVDLKLEIVPIIGNGNLNNMVEMAKNGFNSKWGNFLAEGIVARPSVELKTRNGGRIITKIKHKDFDK